MRLDVDVWASRFSGFNVLGLRVWSLAVYENDPISICNVLKYCPNHGESKDNDTATPLSFQGVCREYVPFHKLFWKRLQRTDPPCSP